MRALNTILTVLLLTIPVACTSAASDAFFEIVSDEDMAKTHSEYLTPGQTFKIPLKTNFAGSILWNEDYVVLGYAFMIGEDSNSSHADVSFWIAGPSGTVVFSLNISRKGVVVRDDFSHNEEGTYWLTWTNHDSNQTIVLFHDWYWFQGNIQLCNTLCNLGMYVPMIMALIFMIGFITISIQFHRYKKLVEKGVLNAVDNRSGSGLQKVQRIGKRDKRP